MISGYEKNLKLAFKNHQEIEIGEITKFLIKNPTFAAYGFHRGFGKLLLSMMMRKKRSENWLLFNLTKFFLLGVSDPNFMVPMVRLLEENAEECAEYSDRYIILYDWLNLREMKTHRVALKKRLQNIFDVNPS